MRAHLLGCFAWFAACSASEPPAPTPCIPRTPTLEKSLHQPPLLTPLLPGRRGADKSPKNGDDKTALEVAEMNEQEAVVALLRA